MERGRGARGRRGRRARGDAPPPDLAVRARRPRIRRLRTTVWNSLSLFHVPPQCTMSRVFIGDDLPSNPRNLHRNALQRLDSWNIPRTRPYFYTMQWVTVGFPLCSRAHSRTSSSVRMVFATVAETTQEAPLRSSSHIVARDLRHRGQSHSRDAASQLFTHRPSKSSPFLEALRSEGAFGPSPNRRRHGH